MKSLNELSSRENGEDKMFNIKEIKFLVLGVCLGRSGMVLWNENGSI